MDQYDSQGHMEAVPYPDPAEEANYLPHHAVIRKDALTTKHRVVYDTSTKNSNGKSLNDEQLLGPVVQLDLVSILIRSRRHKAAITGDIEIMYIQILLYPSQWDYQRIVWRRNFDDPPTNYRLFTVSYGTEIAPFLATRCLIQIADDIQSKNPQIADIIRYDFYMDDLLSGADSREDAAKILEEVIQVLKGYGFPLRKWASNKPFVIQQQQTGTDKTEYLACTLCMKWNTDEDTFSFVAHLKLVAPNTMRSFLSEIAGIYDPMGFAAPVIITAKMLMQELWRAKVTWDEPMPAAVKKMYDEFRLHLPCLADLTIPRWIHTTTDSDFELHGDLAMPLGEHLRQQFTPE